ncbi:cation-translocating P-type ATPase [Planotetraspora sp. A-T 1434]|uniref:cation-translocating P-type ATPase n=1 Tax=Planotetraspora sp. A-T 1434 TaxID=2979219 RepID=UPI0021C1A25F|nr:cation-translocating P-type ATPase [Planotetraspora sp. A-T 1434]MCT9934834.1 cation-translocating P-type ATPase [Planotetraspora sp. A-T 1434]
MIFNRVLTTSATLLRGVLPEPLRDVLPSPRELVTCPGGLRIALRGIGGPGTERAAERLEKRLCEVPNVERAEVNGRLGSVFVGCDPEKVNQDELLEIVKELDEQEERAHYSPVRLVEEHARATIRLAAGVAGIGLVVAGNAAKLPRLSPAVPALLHLADSTPKLREELDRRLGRRATNALFTTTTLVTQTLTLRPIGLLVQSVVSAGKYVEARAGRHAWELLEERLAHHVGAYRHIMAPARPRPCPLPHGPIERYADLASPAAAGGYAVTRVFTRSNQRALSFLVSATPKTADLTREAFAGAIGRALGRRDAIVFDGEALRRMDRVDTVILHADALTTGSWTIDRVVPIGDGMDTGELYARLYTLIDVTDPGGHWTSEDWAAGPLSDRDDLDRHLPAEAAAWRERGLRPIGVTRGGRLIAVAGLAPEIDPMAEALVAAAKAAATVMLAGGGDGLARRLTIERTVPGGPDLDDAGLGDFVLGLQRECHGVVVVSRASRLGLAQADIGVGVMGSWDAISDATPDATPDTTPDTTSDIVPWDGDVVGALNGVHLFLSCLPRAVSASQNGVRLGAAGGVIGGLLAIAGPEATSLRRAQLASGCVSVAAVVLGEWMGRGAGRVPTPLRADTTPWHAMAARDVLSRLRSSPNGIPEAEAVQRRGVAGPDETERPPSLARTTVEELANPLTPALATGAGISALVGSALDAVLISAVMVINAFLGGVQRFKADQALNRLTEATAVHVRLRRPEGTVEAAREDLAPGDVVELRAGDAVPADGRVIRAVGLEVDESTLTGESQLVTKTAAPTVAAAVADRSSMVYQGTTVAAGSGRAVIVATGDMTEAGRSARLAGEPRPPTGVELRLRALSRRILPISIGSGVFLLLTELLRGRPLAAALTPAVSLTVAAVPEGLPFVATVAELAAARRLSKRAALVRNPSTIEALGRVNVLCFDKTGTLTEGHISLRYVSDGRTGWPVDTPPPALKRIVAAAVRASPRSGVGRVIPHPTDRAVVDGAQRMNVTPEEGLDTWERVDELPFEPGRGYHAVLGRTESGHLLSVKGAPEIVLTHCTKVLRDSGEAPCDERVRRELEREVDRLAHQGYRVLAVAQRPASDRRDLDESRIDELCFLGFLGLADPVRPTAAESVSRLVRAGVRIVMVTGDHPSTAEAIASELNALNGQRVMTGPELDEVDDETLTKVLPEVAVFARATPAHKARIVTCLRRAGEVVAVTGDGANDAPAIRMADVGIALGSRATPAARAAADLVVTDDRIETIVAAIVEGRAMWSSVRDSLSILLGGNIGEVAFTVGSTLLAGRSALNARQLLLVNLLTDMVPAMAVAVRPPAATDPERLLAEGPEASLGASLTRDIYLRAVVTTTAATAAWLLGRVTGTRGRADTIGLVALVSAQLFQTLVKGGRDKVVALAALSSLAVLGAIVTVPGVSGVFGCRPIGPFGWAIGLGSAAAATIAGMALEPLAETAPSARTEPGAQTERSARTDLRAEPPVARQPQAEPEREPQPEEPQVRPQLTVVPA